MLLLPRHIPCPALKEDPQRARCKKLRTQWCAFANQSVSSLPRNSSELSITALYRSCDTNASPTANLPAETMPTAGGNVANASTPHDASPIPLSFAMILICSSKSYLTTAGSFGIRDPNLSYLTSSPSASSSAFCMRSSILVNKSLISSTTATVAREGFAMIARAMQSYARACARGGDGCDDGNLEPRGANGSYCIQYNS